MVKDENNKLLSRGDLFSMATGMVIGVGIMTMTGIAIGYTGRSVNLAYIVAGILTVIAAIPQIFIGGTANFEGGQYSQIAVLSGKKLAGIQTYINLFMILSISMYTISFGEYFLSVFPGANIKLVSIIILTVMVGMHLTGVKQAARLQNVMVVIVALAIALYITFGIGSIQPGYFSGPEFATGGINGFMIASIYLTFAAGGATFVVNYSSQAKNPTKDIPFVIIASTAFVVVLYAIIATIAAGVLPVSEVAFKPLSVSAKVCLSGPLYTFFVVGGAMFALLTTLNFTIGMMLNPFIRACKDGWLPKGLAQTNNRFGTPHWILLGIYIIGLVPIIVGLDLTQIANVTVILTTAIRGVIAFAALSLPKKLPELWEKSNYYVSNGKLLISCIASMILAFISVCMLVMSGSKEQTISNLIILAISVIFTLLRCGKVTISAGIKE